MTLTNNDWTNIVLVSTLLLSVLKPIMEALPFMRPSASQHDNILRAISLLFCLGCVLWLAATRDALSMSHAWDYVVYTAQNFAGSQGTYYTLTKSGTALASLQSLVQSKLNTSADTTANEATIPAGTAPLSDSVPADILAEIAAR